MTAAGAGEPVGRPRLLLTGDATARPPGLERALTRAGFHLDEVPPGAHDPPDALLTTLFIADYDQLRRLLASAASEPPRIIVFAAEDRDGPAAALALGAADALAAPVHLPELCARVVARIRDRQVPSHTAHETRVRESLRDLVDGARPVLYPNEIALALVRRLGRALDLAHCAFVITRPGADEGRVIADAADGRTEHGPLDLNRYPEIGEAVRSRRPLSMTDGHAGGSAQVPIVVLPVTLENAVAGVLLMRRQESAPRLNATQLELAGSLAEVAARVLDGARATGSHGLTPPTLERRLQEELERARRYSLGFSLVLLGVASETSIADSVPNALPRQEFGARLRRELRLPDFVSGYGDGDFAVVLPETGADGARRSVARLRERLSVTSAGIVAFPHPSVSAPDDLLALGEAALRRGRAQGGERIGIAE